MDNKENKGGWKKSFFSGVAVTVMVFITVLAIMRIIPGDESRPGSYATHRKLAEAEKLIDAHFIGEEDKQLMSDYLFVGMVAALGDRYSAYFTKEEYAEISKSQKGYYNGIGVTVGKDEEEGLITVTDVFIDGPADKAGILVNDVIVKINGTDVTDKTVSDAVDLIHNAEDPDIVLTVLREDEPDEMEITVRRDDVELESVESRVIEGTDTGYIAISYFSGLVPEQFEKAFAELQEQNIDSLIIDLRGNPGGLVTSVCDTLRQILPKGDIFYMTDKNGKRKTYECDGENEIQIPLVVLVDGESASASEIFAGAVQDYGIGKIVGTETFGKGIVQDVYRLSDGSVLRLTVAHYYTPNGNDIHEKGIKPDVEVEDDKESETDEALEAALKVLELY